MIIRRLTNPKPFDLPENFKVSVEIHNPLFNDMGSTTLPISLPATENNKQILGLMSGMQRSTPLPTGIRVIIEAGAYRKEGVINILGITSKVISVNILLDESEVYAKIDGDKMLSEIFTNVVSYGAESEYIKSAICSNPEEHDYLIFPLRIGIDGSDEDSALFINRTDTSTFVPSRDYNTRADGSVIYRYPLFGQTVRTYNIDSNDIQCGIGFGISPQLRIGYMLKTIFSYFKVTLKNNIFDTDDALKYACCVNNTIDAALRENYKTWKGDTIQISTVRYNTLVPSCTVSEFISALRNCFGIELISTDKEVSIVLTTDIYASKVVKENDYTGRLSAPIEYSIAEKKQLSFSSEVESASDIYLPSYQQPYRVDSYDASGTRTGRTFSPGPKTMDKQFSPLSSYDEMVEYYKSIDDDWDETIGIFKELVDFVKSASFKVAFVQEYEMYYCQMPKSFTSQTYADGSKVTSTEYTCIPVAWGACKAKGIELGYSEESRELGKFLPNVRGFISINGYRLCKSHVETEGQDNAKSDNTLADLDIFFAFAWNPFYDRRSFEETKNGNTYNVLNLNDTCNCCIHMVNRTGFSILPTGPCGATERLAPLNNLLKSSMHTATLSPVLTALELSKVTTTDKIVVDNAPLLLSSLKYEIDSANNVVVLDSEYMLIKSFDGQSEPFEPDEADDE